MIRYVHRYGVYALFTYVPIVGPIRVGLVKPPVCGDRVWHIGEGAVIDSAGLLRSMQPVVKDGYTYVVCLL